MIAREIALYSEGGGGVDAIVELGLQSDYQCDGKDVIKTLRRVYMHGHGLGNT